MEVSGVHSSTGSCKPLKMKYYRTEEVLTVNMLFFYASTLPREAKELGGRCSQCNLEGKFIGHLHEDKAVILCKSLIINKTWHRAQGRKDKKGLFSPASNEAITRRDDLEGGISST